MAQNCTTDIYVYCTRQSLSKKKIGMKAYLVYDNKEQSSATLCVASSATPLNQVRQRGGVCTRSTAHAKKLLESAGLQNTELVIAGSEVQEKKNTTLVQARKITKARVMTTDPVVNCTSAYLSDSDTKVMRPSTGDLRDADHDPHINTTNRDAVNDDVIQTLNGKSTVSKFSVRAIIPKRRFHGTITWADEIACEIAQVIGSNSLTNIAASMQQEHVKLNKHNRKAILLETIEGMSSPHMNRLRHLLEQNDKTTLDSVNENLNEPTLEVLAVFEHIVLPSQNARVFTSTATANSGNDNAFVCALRILGLDKNIEFVHTSTCVKETGKTGVSHVDPLHTAIEYSRTCKRENWAEMSFDLAQQFVKASGDGDEEFDAIFHSGCNSQNKQRSRVSNHPVTSWKLHEEWNVMMDVAMMWHAVKTLKHGGALYVKVRIMDRAETMGLVAVLSLAFDSVKIIPNSRQLGTFALVVAEGATNDDKRRELVLRTLEAGMSFEPVDTYMSDLALDNVKLFKMTVSECQKVRRYMQEEKAIRTTLFLQCLWLLSEYAKTSSKMQKAECETRVYDVLKQRYKEPLCEKLTERFMHAIHTMPTRTKACFLRCMQTRWMKENC